MRTYGKLTYQRGKWHLKAEHHVFMRFSRLFLGASCHPKTATATIEHKPETARDLAWFLDRFPMEVSEKDRKRLDDGAQAYDEACERTARVLSLDFQPTPVELALPPRSYQLVPAELAMLNGGAVCGDDVGLGKTIEGIVLLARPEARPALVVTLPHLCRQWEAEIKRFLPSVRTQIIESGSPGTKGKGASIARAVEAGVPMPDVIITAYSRLSGWAEWFGGRIRSIVYDEAHELRHGESTQKGKAAASLASVTQWRMGLSVGPNSAVLMRGGPFGDGWHGRIEDAWSILKPGRNIKRLASGHDILDISEAGIESRGWSEHGFAWKPVQNVLRHACDRQTRTIMVAGQELTVTDDHSVYVVRDAKLEYIPSAEILVGDVIPRDNGAEWDEREEVPVDITMLNLSTKTQVLVDLSGETRRSLNITPQEWQKFAREGTYGTRLPLAIYLRERHRLPEPTGLYHGRCRRPSMIDAKVRLSSWAYVLGFFLGDGWVDKNGQRTSFAVENERVEDFVSRLKKLPGVRLDPKIRKMEGNSVEVRCSNAFFSRVILHALGNKKCYDKTIPIRWITTWAREARMELLRGLNDSDGHLALRERGKERLYYTTVSRDLARTLALLVQSLGIPASTTKTKAKPGGTFNERPIIGKRQRYTVNWSRYAMDGDNSGHRGARCRYTAFSGKMHDGIVRATMPIDPPSWVYDFEMDGHPSFVADGLLVHNTATPIYGYGGEIYNVIDLIAPDALGSREEFGRTWCESGRLHDKSIVSDPAALGAFLRERGVFIRRTAAEVGRELPKVTIVPHVCDVDAHEIDRSVGGVEAEEIAKRVLSGGSGARGEAMQAGGELDWMLRQATGVAKAPVVAEFVRMLVESGEKVVLYAWHRAVYDIFAERLRDLRPVFYTGEESATIKEKAVETFTTDDRCRVFIASLRAGTGLNRLQFASRIVVFAELDWAPAQMEQCIGRLNRDGQANPVMAYYLISESGSDPVIADTLGIKRVQAESIRDGRDASVAIEQRDPGGAKRLARAFLRSRGYTAAQIAAIEKRDDAHDEGDELEREWAAAVRSMPSAAPALPLFEAVAS